MLIDEVNWLGVGLHLQNGQTPHKNETGYHGFGHGGEVSDCSPIEISSRIFNKSEQVFESSSLVSFVDTFSAESVLLEFPIVLFTDGSA